MKGEGGKKLVQWRAAVCFLLGMQVTHTHTDTHTHTHTCASDGRNDACYVNACKTLEFSCAWLDTK